MRVPGSITTRRYLNNYNSSLERMNKFNEQLTSWRKFDKVSDDPAAAAKAFLVRRQLSRIDMYQSNLKSAKDLLSSAETSATNVGNSIKLASSTLSAAVNGTSKDSNEVLAQQLENYRDEIIKTMNNNFGGRYLFGGTSNEAPFSLDANGKLLFNGEPVSAATSAADFPKNKDVFIDIGLGMEFDPVTNDIDPQTALKISTSGIDFLGFGTDANGLENNICDEITTVANTLRDPNADLESCRPYIDKFEEQRSRVFTSVADIGNRISYIDYNVSRLDSDTLTLQETQNNIEVINPAETITELKSAETTYKACLQIGPRLIQSSLFDYLR